MEWAGPYYRTSYQLRKHVIDLTILDVEFCLDVDRSATAAADVVLIVFDIGNVASFTYAIGLYKSLARLNIPILLFGNKASSQGPEPTCRNTIRLFDLRNTRK